MESQPRNFSLSLGLNLFIEFGPILLFFVMFNLFDFIVATVALVGIVVGVLFLSLYVEGRVATFSLFASGSIIVFGGATIYFSNPLYLKYSDTLFWGLFSLVILGYYLRQVLLLKILFSSIFDITDVGWRIVTIRWMLFAFLLACANLLAVWYLTTEQWVTYRMGVLGALILFSVWQFFLSRKERNATASSWGLRV